MILTTLAVFIASLLCGGQEIASVAALAMIINPCCCTSSATCDWGCKNQSGAPTFDVTVSGVTNNTCTDCAALNGTYHITLNVNATDGETVCRGYNSTTSTASTCHLPLGPNFLVYLAVVYYYGGNPNFYGAGNYRTVELIIDTFSVDNGYFIYVESPPSVEEGLACDTFSSFSLPFYGSGVGTLCTFSSGTATITSA